MMVSKMRAKEMMDQPMNHRQVMCHELVRMDMIRLTTSLMINLASKRVQNLPVFYQIPTNLLANLPVKRLNVVAAMPSIMEQPPQGSEVVPLWTEKPVS